MSFELISPRWLWGLAGLLVPVAIHLLSRGSSPRLRLGTTRFLLASPTRTARRVRLTEPVLLAVRCLALAVLVLILADPVRWRTPAEARSSAGWLLVDPVLLGGLEWAPGLAEAISERRVAGWKVGILAPGFPSLGPDPGPRDGSTLSGAVEASRAVSAPHADLWSLAREAVWQEAPGVPIEFMSSNRLASIEGSRPSFPEEVSWRVWQTTGGDGPVNRWIESARDLGSDELEVVLGRSEPRGTSFKRARPGEVSVRADGSARTVRLAPPAPGEDSDPVPGDDSLEIPADVPVVRIAVVFETDRDADRNYLLAALRTLAGGLPHRLEIADGRLPPTDAPVEILFWLSSDPVSEAARSAVARGGVLFEDAGALWEDCTGSVEVRSLGFETWRCSNPAAAADGTTVQPLWRLPSGRSLLWGASKDSTNELLFASRFHPQWSSLVWSPVFLEWLETLVLQVAPPGSTPTAAKAESDVSALAEELLVPAANGVRAPRRREADRSPALALWVALLGALALERCLAERTGSGAG